MELLTTLIETLQKKESMLSKKEEALKERETALESRKKSSVLDAIPGSIPKPCAGISGFPTGISGGSAEIPAGMRGLMKKSVSIQDALEKHAWEEESPGRVKRPNPVPNNPKLKPKPNPNLNS